MPLASWDLRGIVEVLYTPQKAARRPKFREGTFRVESGRAALVDSAGRELDAETVTEALVEQLRCGEEIDFPGHLIQPQQALVLRPEVSPRFPESTSHSRSHDLPASRAASSNRASMRLDFTDEAASNRAHKSFAEANGIASSSSTPVNAQDSNIAIEQTSEKKAHQPFKRPRVAADASSSGASFLAQASSTLCEAPCAAVAQFRSAAPRVEGLPEKRVPESVMIDSQRQGATRTTPHVVTQRNLWQECVHEDRMMMLHRPSTTTSSNGLWETCVKEDNAARQGVEQVETLVVERLVSRPVATPCRESGLETSTFLPLASAITRAAAGEDEQHPQQPSRRREELGDRREMTWRAPVQKCNEVQQACDPGCPEEVADSDEDEVFLRALEEEQAKNAESDDDRPLAELSKKTRVDKLEVKKPFRIKRPAVARQSPQKSKLRAAGNRAGRAVKTLLPLRFSETPNISPLPSRAVSRHDLYVHHFVHGLLCDVQARLSDIAVAWRKVAGDVGKLPLEVNIVAKTVLVGVALESVSVQSCSGTPPTESQSSTSVPCITLIFGRRTVMARGSTRSSAKGDLWVLLPPGFEPVLVKAIWRGISPRGRLLCIPVNDAAVHWISTRRGRQNLVTMTGLSSSAFSAELEQIDAFHTFADEFVSCNKELAHGGSHGDVLSGILLGANATHSSESSDSPPQSEPPKLSPKSMETLKLMSLSDEQASIARWVASWVEASSDPHAVLVRGVFGSGKSHALAACIKLLDQALNSQKDPRRILLVCQTNAAVDNVLKVLLTQHSWDDFARLGSFKTVHPSLLHRTVSLLSTRQAAEKELSEALSRLPPDVVGPLQQAVERGVLPPKGAVWRRRRLVAATVASLSAAEHLGDATVRCPFALVDEATQLTEPAVFFCLRRAMAQRILLMGDPRQLPPRARHAPLARSLLERLWDDGPAAARATLSKQYRCHPSIAQLAGGLFYGGEIAHGVSAADRQSILGTAASPLVVLLSEGVEARSGHSYEHLAEARLCASWVQRVMLEAAGRLRSEHFGVVCLYRPQAAACATQLAGRGLRDVEASTVDAFQGSEREVIVLSCGRSSPLRNSAPLRNVGRDTVASSSLGGGDAFAVCPRRLNVALTRARRHLIVVGAEAFLRSHPHLSKVLEVARSQGSVFAARDVGGS